MTRLSLWGSLFLPACFCFAWTLIYACCSAHSLSLPLLSVVKHLISVQTEYEPVCLCSCSCSVYLSNSQRFTQDCAFHGVSSNMVPSWSWFWSCQACERHMFLTFTGTRHYLMMTYTGYNSPFKLAMAFHMHHATLGNCLSLRSIPTKSIWLF